MDGEDEELCDPEFAQLNFTIYATLLHILVLRFIMQLLVWCSEMSPVCAADPSVRDGFLPRKRKKKKRHSDFEQYLSESGHRLAGDDLISAQTGDEAQGLVLVLPAFQFAQDQSAENLHILQGTRDEQTE